MSKNYSKIYKDGINAMTLEALPTIAEQQGAILALIGSMLAGIADQLEIANQIKIDQLEREEKASKVEWSTSKDTHKTAGEVFYTIPKDGSYWIDVPGETSGRKDLKKGTVINMKYFIGGCA